MSYDWDKNCAIVDRLSYFQYTLRTTITIFGILAFKDLIYINDLIYNIKIIHQITITK